MAEIDATDAIGETLDRATAAHFAAVRSDVRPTTTPASRPGSDRIGGSFAPPLTADVCDRYAALAATAPPQVRDAMGVLLVLANEYRKSPSATAPGKPHPSGRGTVVPLAVAVADALDPLVPWDEELVMFAAVFDRIDAGANKPLRDAAHHLLWYAKELSLGREPITTDRLGG